MKKKFSVILMSLILSAAILSGCTDSIEESSSSADGTQTTESTSNESGKSTALIADAFAEGDTRDVSSEEANAVVTLSGSEGTLSDTTRGSSGSDVTITAKGIYEITGSSENVSIIVNDEKKSGNIYLVLNNVTMNNSEKPCIIVENSEKVILVTKDGSANSLNYTAAENSEGLDGAVYSADDLTLAGSGELSVESALHGIVCKDDFKAVGGTAQITASSIGIKAGDSVRIGGAAVNVQAGHDGVQAENKDGTSFFYIESGSLSVEAGYDGIDVGTSDSEFTGSVTLAGGTVNITAGGGSENSENSEKSQKGIKCDGAIVLGDAEINVSSADDAVNGKGDVSITGGSAILSTSDDGITAGGKLAISGGTLTIAKAYEALEGADVDISGGNLMLKASDDGINAGGGSDAASSDGDEYAAGSGTITISGGEIMLSASGDGLDANGSVYVKGGTLIIEGPTDSGNGAIDKGDGEGCTAQITGGTVLALGSKGMAVNFDSGSQCAALVSLSGSANTEIAVNDGSGFTYTPSKTYECVLYSSPDLKEGSTYTISAGSGTAEFSFADGLYFNNVN